MTASLQASLFGGPEIKVPKTIGKAAVASIESLHLLNPGKGQVSGFDYTLNPYRGCSFDCSYCYAPSFVAEEDKQANWGRWVEVKKNALMALDRADLGDKSVLMSSVTDPYQPLEAKTELTRAIVERLLEMQPRLVVQTRSPIVERDIDLFKRFRSIRVNVSSPTDSEEVRRAYEPSCASIERRLRTVETLARNGLKTTVCISPMLPMDDPGLFGKRLDEIGASRVVTSWFHESNRAFASNTRKMALGLNSRYGWTEDGFRDCYEALKGSCRAFSGSYK